MRCWAGVRGGQALHPREYGELRDRLQASAQYQTIERSLDALKVCVPPFSHPLKVRIGADWGESDGNVHHKPLTRPQHSLAGPLVSCHATPDSPLGHAALLYAMSTGAPKLAGMILLCHCDMACMTKVLQMVKPVASQVQ